MRRGAPLMVLALGLIASGSDFIIGWEPSPSATDPVHMPTTYRVYKAENGATNFWHTDDTQIRFRNPTNGAEIRIWVTTLNAVHDESEPSDVLTYDTGERPNAPQNLRMIRR